MLIAYNNDIEFRSRWYHIQTEDNGLKDGHITTTVFYSGQILDSLSTSYMDAIAGAHGEEEQNKIIKAMMTAQHKHFYTKLYEGTYEAAVNAKEQHRSAAPSGTSPSPSRRPVAPVQPVIAAARPSDGGHGSVPQPAVGVRENSANHAVSGGSGNVKIGKPDILRASQQLPGVSKGLALKSVNGLAAQPGTRAPSSPAISKTTSRKPGLVTSLPVSNAVLEQRRKMCHTAWRGVSWPESDIAIDLLIAKLLDGQNV